MNNLNKRNALGKGLSALLESPETDITSKSNSKGESVVGSISQLSMTQIEANPFQPRTFFEEEALQELASSIKEIGLIQPVTVRKMGYDKYQLISGERRFRASQLAGLEAIPAYIRIANDQSMLEMALVENIQREELDAIEIAQAYERLIEELKLTQEQVSEKVAKKRSTISNYLRLLKLPAEIQLGIRQRKLSMGHARALVNIEDKVLQLNLFNQIISNELSVRQVEEVTRSSKPENQSAVKSSVNTKLGKEITAELKKLMQSLESPLDIKMNNEGKGVIRIHFNTQDELNQLFRKLNP